MTAMSNLHNLLQWWNLLFALPLVVGMLFSLITALGFASTGHAAAERGDIDQGDTAHEMDTGDGDSEHGDIGQDTDLHAEHDHAIDSTSAEVAVGEAGHDAAAEHADETTHDHHESVLTQILEAFGIGRGVPISVMLPFCMMLWGVLGLVSNQALHPLLRFPAVYVWISVLVSLLGTSLLARGLSGVVARYLQMGQVANMSRERLIGATGIAVFTIDERGGVADVHDRVGTIHRIPCRVRERGTPLPAGTPVVVADYESETGTYLVEENPFADSITHQEVRT